MNQPCIPNLKEHHVDKIVAAARDAIEDLPEAFEEELRALAKGGLIEKGASWDWHIEHRPYSVSELARVPGMPSRQKLQGMLNDLGLSHEERFNEAGKLTPTTVAALVERMNRSRAEINGINHHGYHTSDGEGDKALSMRGLCEELGKSRTTMWRWFNMNPKLQEKLLSSYEGGHPLYSLKKVRMFKAGRIR